MNVRTWLVPGTVVAVLVGVWAWQPSRDFLLGRVDNTVGTLYARGFGVARDPAEALRWYDASAARGVAAGQFNLAYALQQGAGVEADPKRAAHWYELAAQQGNALAANNLGLMYADGSLGTPDAALATQWLERARVGADRELAATVDENLRAIEHDRKTGAFARSEPAPATRAPPRVDPPLPDLAQVDRAAARRQIAAAIAAAAPMREAATRYLRDNRRLPSPDAVAGRAEFATIDTPAARVALDVGGMIDVVLRSAPLDGQSLSLVPVLGGGKLSWICARGRLPPQYFATPCP